MSASRQLHSLSVCVCIGSPNLWLRCTCGYTKDIGWPTTDLIDLAKDEHLMSTLYGRDES